MRRHELAGLVVLAVAASAAPSPATEPPLVRSVVVRSESPVDRERMATLLAIAPGRPLTPEAVRRTLRNLRLAGVASDVEIRRRPAEDGSGVIAEVVLHPEIHVVAVEIAGAPDLPSEDLRSRLVQRAGEPLREDAVVRGVYRLEEALESEGWLDASVRLEVDPGLPGGVGVVYRVDAGRRWTVGEVELAGLGDLPEAKALEALKARPGRTYRAATVREDPDLLRRFLIRSGYRMASVAPPAERRRADDAAVDLAYVLELGPKVTFELVGADRKALEKRDLLPFLGDDGFDEALWLQAISEIRRNFQERGHYEVEVRDHRETSDGELRLRLEVVPGPKYELEEVRFEGELSYERERLSRLMATAPRKLLSLGRDGLVDDRLAEDLANLRSFYALEGYARPRVGSARVETLGDDRLRVIVPIDEGPRRIVRRVTIEGLHAVDPKTLLPKLALSSGGPFHPLHVEASAGAIRRALDERGYRAAIVEPEIEWGDSELEADVTFRVLEGERSEIELLVVRGASRTKEPVVRRFLGLERGDPISTEGLLDAQRSLYGLGIFSRVDVRVPTVDAEFRSSEVVVDVEEGRTRAVAYGAGWDSDSGARGLLRFSHSNLGGRAATLQIDALVAQRDQLFRGLLRQPYLGPWPIEGRIVGYRQVEDRPTFDVKRSGAQVGLERVNGSLRLGLYGEYRLVELETDASLDVIPRESRDARVASFSPTLFWDRRDDPIDPKRGWSLLLQLERAVPFGSADADFEKLFAQWTAARSVGFGTVALSLRAGGLHPLGEAEETGLRPIDAVPAAELFYAGGRTSHRAFARDELGIPGQTLFVEEGEDPIPLGGGVLALASLEWRFPFAGALGGTLFVDGGNVWREIGDFDAGDARWGAGAGLRYASPIGPLRLEVGWKLDREPFEDPYVWFISLGNAF